jgi:hypothetical protein
MGAAIVPLQNVTAEIFVHVVGVERQVREEAQLNSARGKLLGHAACARCNRKHVLEGKLRILNPTHSPPRLHPTRKRTVRRRHGRRRAVLPLTAAGWGLAEHVLHREVVK